MVSGSPPQTTTISLFWEMSFTMLSAGFIIPDQTLAPDVPGTPVPALPAVRVAHLLGEAAHLVEEQGGAAVRRVDELALAVTVALHQDGQRPVLLVDPLDLGGDKIGGLVPGDAHVLALATVLRIALALWIPVHPLEGVLDPVGRVGPLLVGEAPGGGSRLHQRLESLAVLLYLPRIEGRRVVLLVEVERPDAHDLAVLHIDGAGHGAVDSPAQTQGFENRLVNCLRMLRLRHDVTPSPRMTHTFVRP